MADDSGNTNVEPDHSKVRLNFLLLGAAGSGMRAISTSMIDHPDAVCHEDLLYVRSQNNHDPIDLVVREAAHRRYFGEKPVIKNEAGEEIERPDYCHPTETSGEMYLRTQVFPFPRNQETVVGCKVTYRELEAHQLQEFLKEMTLRGDFCVVHVVRNPVTALVADYAGTCNSDGCVQLDAESVIEACRLHEIWSGRIASLCDDRIVVQYDEIRDTYKPTMKAVFEFLDLEVPRFYAPDTVKTGTLPIHERVANWRDIQRKLPHNVLTYFREA